MLRRTIASVLIAALVAPAAAVAQAPEKDGKNPADLPVSLERIRRELAAQTRTTETKDGLRLNYYIEVYGQAPRLELFAEGENIAGAAVMYGGMTHQEFLQFVTPQEFRSPAANIPGAVAALLKWLAEKRKNGSAKR